MLALTIIAPYLAEYDNWGNAAELIYGNSKEQRNNNGYYHDDCCILDEKGIDVIWKNWK